MRIFCCLVILFCTLSSCDEETPSGRSGTYEYISSTSTYSIRNDSIIIEEFLTTLERSSAFLTIDENSGFTLSGERIFSETIVQASGTETQQVNYLDTLSDVSILNDLGQFVNLPRRFSRDSIGSSGLFRSNRRRFSSRSSRDTLLVDFSGSAEFLSPPNTRITFSGVASFQKI